MGYYTVFDLDFKVVDNHYNYKDLETTVVNVLKEVNPSYFNENYIETIDDCFSEEMKWYDYKEDMTEVSKKVPGVLFTLSGDGEDRDDIWKEYFYEGKWQHAHIQYVFDEPDIEKLMGSGD